MEILERLKELNRFDEARKSIKREDHPKTIIEMVQRDAKELDSTLGWMCANRCKRYDEVRSSSMSDGACGSCRMNILVAKRMNEAGLLGGNDGDN